MILIIPVFWVLFSLLTMIMASKRNRSIFGWFIFSILFSPLVAWMFLLALGKLDIEIKPKQETPIREEIFSTKSSVDFGYSIAKHRYAILFSIIFLILIVKFSI